MSSTVYIYICGEGEAGEGEHNAKMHMGKTKICIKYIYIYTCLLLVKSKRVPRVLQQGNLVEHRPWYVWHLLCRAGQAGKFDILPAVTAVCCISSQHNETGLYLHCCIL